MTQPTIRSEVSEMNDVLKRQVEYYFSPHNLAKDYFMRDKMDDEENIPVAVIAKFKKVISIISVAHPNATQEKTEEIIVSALKGSDVVTISSDSTKLRSSVFSVHNKRTTLILREVSENVLQADIAALVEKFSTVSIKKEVAGTWFVEFKEESEARNALASMIGRKLDGVDIMARIKSSAATLPAMPPVPASQRYAQGASPAGAPLGGNIPPQVPNPHMQMPYNMYYGMNGVPVGVNPYAPGGPQGQQPYPLFVPNQYPGYVYNPAVSPNMGPAMSPGGFSDPRQGTAFAYPKSQVDYEAGGDADAYNQKGRMKQTKPRFGRGKSSKYSPVGGEGAKLSNKKYMHEKGRAGIKKKEEAPKVSFHEQDFPTLPTSGGPVTPTNNAPSSGIGPTSWVSKLKSTPTDLNASPAEVETSATSKKEIPAPKPAVVPEVSRPVMSTREPVSPVTSKTPKPRRGWESVPKAASKPVEKPVKEEVETPGGKSNAGGETNMASAKESENPVTFAQILQSASEARTSSSETATQDAEKDKTKREDAATSSSTSWRQKTQIVSDPATSV